MHPGQRKDESHAGSPGQIIRSVPARIGRIIKVIDDMRSDELTGIVRAVEAATAARMVKAFSGSGEVRNLAAKRERAKETTELKKGPSAKLKRGQRSR
jgi:hypothetical protein